MVHAQDSKGNAVLTPISQLKIGDKVLAKSEWKAEGENLSYEPITDIISTPNHEQKWVYVTLSDGKVITATQGHPFRTAEGWRDAVLLKKGDTLILTDSDGKPSTIQIDGIRYETKVLTTFNLEVANAHTFFVGEDAVLVHNAKGAVGTITQSNGTVTHGRSTGAGGPGIHNPIVQKVYDKVPNRKRSPFHGNCVEADALSQIANREGVETVSDLRKAVNGAVANVTGKADDVVKPACSSCAWALNHLGVK